MLPILALEDMARRAELSTGFEVLLDALEAAGELGRPDEVAGTRARLTQIVRSRAKDWTARPEIAIGDFYAHTLDLACLGPARLRWQAELDARGPWLRPLRAVPPFEGALAELEAPPLAELSFLSEDRVSLRPKTGERLAWSWRIGLIKPCEREPLSPSVPPPTESPQVPIPWPQPGHAEARLSRDRQRVIAHGWYEDDEYYSRCESVQIFSVESLERLSWHNVGTSITALLECPTDERVLVSSLDALTIIHHSESEPWSLDVGPELVAWSPNGRHICTSHAGVLRIWDTHATRQGGELPTTFSPDGARLVDGNGIFDAHTGAPIARLHISLGGYLAGGPARPWLSVGSELTVCTNGDIGMWRTSTGEPVPLPERHLHAPHWESLAYDASGTLRAKGHTRSTDVELSQLPANEPIATLDFDIRTLALALSSTGELIAAGGDGRVEVRRRDGARVFSANSALIASQDPDWGIASFELRFSADDVRLDCRARDGEGSESWDLSTGAATDPAPETPLPPGWTLESDSVFVHSSGARASVPLRGPWRRHPTNPRILACPGGLYELRARDV
jgi:WD40 repeat protein